MAGETSWFRRELSIGAAVGISVALAAPLACGVGASRLLLGYTIYRNVVPFPTGEAGWNAAICAVWPLIAIAVVVAWPAIARRAGEWPTADQGFAPTREPA